MANLKIDQKVKCYHCGEDCVEDTTIYDEKSFCCPGCKLVYEVLNENQLCNYYDLSDNPGTTRKNVVLGERYAYLDDEGIQQKLIKFRDAETAHLRFHVPNMHCSSCIWLLEHLQKIDKGIVRSKVDFIQKELLIVYKPDQTNVRKIVEQLSIIGYEPELNLDQVDKVEKKKKVRTRVLKIGLAGFAFGNIMLLSFPEYFSGGVYTGEDFRKVFGYLNFVLALPVFFYSASEFHLNTIRSIRQRAINIDVPIAIGIVAMFIRSTYEIFSGTGAGYFDSMTGLVFFMLIGRNFQDKTYEWLSFDRDYKSYFPIAVTRYRGQTEQTIPVNEIEINDRLKIRNQEIIPADVLLLSDRAEIDYSFVSGESTPVNVDKGERIFAGGRLLRGPIDVLVQQEISHSYLTQLWNQLPDKSSRKSGFQKMVSAISRWFVLGTITIAVTSFAYWYNTDVTRAINAFTAVLVIACACALALSAPFTFGNMLRILGKKGIYLRNADVIERLADINFVVFDKTGTLTEPESTDVEFHGDQLSDEEYRNIFSIASSSSHPLSIMICKQLKPFSNHDAIDNIIEIPGSGVEGYVNGNYLRIGNLQFAGRNIFDNTDFKNSRVYVRINDDTKGYFLFRNKYRSSVKEVADKLTANNFQLSVISGDHEGERPYLEKMLNKNSHLLFNQQPSDKLNYIKSLQDHGNKVMMVGDGLNDAGALMQSNVGIALSSDINNFTPACDGIILGQHFNKLPEVIRFAKAGQRIIIISFIISLFYNALGLWFAVQGTLSPVIAAILMPISTSSLVIYTVIASSIKARRLKLR
jgi:P-type Cu+ transporter